MGFFRANTVTTPKYTPFSTYWKLNLEKDIGLNVPCYFSVLHDLSVLWPTSEDEADNGNLAIHFVKGQPKTPMCNHQYFDADDPESNCEYCLMENAFGNPNNPSLVKPLLVLVHNLIDETRETAQGKIVKEIPIKVLEVPAGQGKKNFNLIAEAHRDGYLSRFSEDGQGSIFMIKRHTVEQKDGSLKKTLSEPVLVAPQQMKSLGNFKLKLEDYPDCLRIKDMPPEELRGLLFDVYGNVKKDDPLFKEIGVTWPVVPEKEDKETETPTVDVDQKRSKK